MTFCKQGNSNMKVTGSFGLRLPMGRMFASALPLVALAMPGTAFAQSVSNTATVAAPSGTTDTNTANNSASDTDTLLANITPNDDSASTTAGGPGITDIISVLGNDDFNGSVPSASDVDITVASGSSVPSQLTFDTNDGTVDVVAGTPAGTYSFDYTICEAGRTDNCDDATVTVTVTAPAISADNETLGPIAGAAGQANIENALDGDFINSVAASVGASGNVTLSVVTAATPVNTGDPVPTLDITTGQVSVPAGTPADDYQITYQICDVVNSGNCATATIDVEVVAATIAATSDSVGGINGTAGADDVLNVLPNDRVGSNTANVGNVDITVVTAATPVNPGDPVPTLDITDGNISVPAGTPAGTYDIVYQICEELNPTNCSRATAQVTVVAPLIDAVNDGPAAVSDGVAGADDVIDVLGNDELNGGQATLANVDITVVTPASGIGGSSIVPVLSTVDGTIDVPANTPAGTYTITYQIEDALNSGNTDTATATVVVSPSVDLSIAKTNNDNDGVMSGDTLTYVLTVSNAGPDAAVGAIVSDSPGAGLTCPATGTLTFGGTASAGAPSGSPTVGSLTGAGVALGTINAGENVTVTYSCSVD
ncbi:beta strand repeat-containing protein [Erythrobacter ani]|uniref:DUF11 domain-containing protein n=1 Tax=Erythrobacter ani TaxID=2827235 RepID=A0ABS6SKL6_9SPHN|nr:DUF11 domain-containing protein [Erythrobacter ani]MBV7264998.1 DUF11 domain-containing protein [Erythrobacter ani]